MKIFAATKNKHKLEELSRILIPMGFQVISENDLSEKLPDVEETGTTFEENALLKANSGLSATGLITVADDSGLCVDFLNGAPGIYSSRYSGENASDSDNLNKLLFELKDVPAEKRTAKFVCCIACVFPDGTDFTVRGECPGRIAEEPHGSGGFGYDPVFISEKGCFALLSPDQKDSVSHRGIALREFENKMRKMIEERKEY